MISEKTLDEITPLPSAANDSDVAVASLSFELADGAVASVVAGALELRDTGGRLLIRYSDGCAEIAAPSGDLVLSAPSGRVVMRSALDVQIEASRDIVHHAGRSAVMSAGERDTRLELTADGAALRGDKLCVATRQANLEAGAISTVARTISTQAHQIAITAAKYELSATRLFERSKDSFREVADLAQTRVGRARTIVSSLFSLRTGRTVLLSKEDTSIDGRKILLG